MGVFFRKLPATLHRSWPIKIEFWESHLMMRPRMVCCMLAWFFRIFPPCISWSNDRVLTYGNNFFFLHIFRSEFDNVSILRSTFIFYAILLTIQMGVKKKFFVMINFIILPSLQRSLPALPRKRNTALTLLVESEKEKPITNDDCMCWQHWRILRWSVQRYFCTPFMYTTPMDSFFLQKCEA